MSLFAVIDRLLGTDKFTPLKDIERLVLPSDWVDGKRKAERDDETKRRSES